MRLRTPLLVVATVALASVAAISSRESRAEVVVPAVPDAAPVAMHVYKSPTCGCCKSWVEHMKQAGFAVTVTDLSETALQQEKTRRGVTSALASCHTAVVGEYVVEGHVPVEDIQRLLREKPAITGIAAPGMPRGSPGMEVPGGVKDAYNVIAFTKSGKSSVFAKH